MEYNRRTTRSALDDGLPFWFRPKCVWINVQVSNDNDRVLVTFNAVSDVRDFDDFMLKRGLKLNPKRRERLLGSNYRSGRS